MDDDQDRLEPSYERALFADLDRLLNAIPHNEIAVQWDVAVVFAVLEGRFEGTPGPPIGHRATPELAAAVNTGGGWGPWRSARRHKTCATPAV